MTSTTSLVELLLLLLIAASVVALITSRLRVPYTAALVFAGVGIDLVRGPITAALATVGMAPGRFDILTPEVVFTLFLPGLLFESSLHLNLRELRENVWPIVVLAAAGVIVATLTTGYAVSLWLGLPIASALVFGALISATDPISVVALFRELGVHRRLTLIVEGESLFNDGTAVVLFQILVAAALGGNIGLAHGLTRFVAVVAGGLGARHGSRRRGQPADVVRGRAANRDHADDHRRLRLVPGGRAHARLGRDRDRGRRIGGWQRRCRQGNELQDEGGAVRVLGVPGVRHQLAALPVDRDRRARIRSAGNRRLHWRSRRPR